MGMEAVVGTAGSGLAIRRGRPPRSESQRATHRRRLVEAAMEAIRRHGADASVEQMAAEAGVSKPVLYAEFGDKLGLVDAIALVLADRVERQVLATLTASRAFDLEGIIGSIVDALVALIDEEPELYSFLVRSIRDSDRSFLDNALVRVIHEKAETMIGLVTKDMDKDELSVLTDGLFGFVLGAVESWLAARVPDRQRLARTLAAVIKAGLLEATRAGGEILPG